MLGEIQSTIDAGVETASVLFYTATNSATCGIFFYMEVICAHTYIENLVGSRPVFCQTGLG